MAPIPPLPPVPHKVELAPSGRASCRGCKETIPKGVLRFAEEFQNPYSEDGGPSYRYWHLSCAATKMANELRDALGSYEGPVDDRAALDAVIAEHVKPDTPYAERAGSGRAKCRACDETIKKGELRVAFDRVFEGPMGPQKGAAYAHPRCVRRYLEREREHGRDGPPLDEVAGKVMAGSPLGAEDLAEVRRELV